MGPHTISRRNLAESGFIKMRILHILDHSLPLQSGYVYRTLGIVNQQRMLGWDPVLLTSGRHYAAASLREQIGEWNVYRTPESTGLAMLPGIRELATIKNLDRRVDEVVREVKPDILHAHSPVLNAIPAIHVGRRHGLPVVYEVRAFWEDARRGSGARDKTSVRYHATWYLETQAMRRADAVIAICDGLSSDIIARGISKTKVTVVPNAVDRLAFAGPRTPDPDLVSRFGLAGKTVLGFFGSFYLYEGLHVLLHALALLRRERPEIMVLLAGGGPEEERLRELAENLDLDAALIFAGRIPHQEIQRYYDLTELLVFPRLSMRVTELVTPLKPLEAMAQERIVLASDVGGHRELIRDGETGYLFSPNQPERLAECVLAALADRANWPQMRARALSYIETERRWEQSVARYVDVYGGILRNW